jgi:hypothetical protein
LGVMYINGLARLGLECFLENASSVNFTWQLEVKSYWSRLYLIH